VHILCPEMPAGSPTSAAKPRPTKESKGTENSAPSEPVRRSTATACRVACRRTFRQVFRAVGTVVDHGVRGFHVLMKIIGPCFICLALGLIGFCTYTYFKYLLPTLEERYGLVGQVLITMLGLYLVLNTLYNYGKAVITDPGLPPEYDEADRAEAEELNQPPPKQCRHCSRSKPARTHHCSICRRCVLKMDHHCPWINNCVGFGNYRHFTLFMLFLAMSCIFVACVFFPIAYEGMFHVRGRRHPGNLSRSARSSIMTSFMIACSIMVALCILGGFHVYLVLTNQSTIEFQLNLLHRREARRNGEYFRNPYDMGRRRNFQAVCGPSAFWSFRWLMPYLSEAAAGDGLNFNSISSLKI